MSESQIALFKGIGCSDKFIVDFVKNPSNVAALEAVILEAGVESGCDSGLGGLLLALVGKLKNYPIAQENRVVVSHLIRDQEITMIPQVEAAALYLNKTHEFNLEELRSACGAGVVVSEQDITDALSALFSKHREEIVEERYRFNFGLKILKSMRSKFPFADGKLVKTVNDAMILELLGPKTAADTAKPKKVKAKKVAKVTENQEEVVEHIEKMYSGRELGAAKNSPKLLEEHNAITGGKIRTRFPPEPNGYLHIGHAKAINFNFGVARRAGGTCFLRFDDTNPSAEEQDFIDSIIDSVNWLGHTPDAVTYSSDCFDQLYEYAVELIRRGKAYVCHQTKAEIKAARAFRMEQPPSPYRDRSVEENLSEFLKMRNGEYKTGEATLRMKIDITAVNPCMWDPVAYRIKFEAHPHVGDKWCIYPSYDFTHCLVDSLEHITNSLCTLEFEGRRDSYYWLLEALDVYRPMVWEYGRLSITHNVMSKRKLKYMVETGIVRGWDDPRMLTLNGLRRRGFTPEAINDFCERIGVSRITTSYVQYGLLEACARNDLNTRACRAMVVVDPLKMVITNLESSDSEVISVPDFPEDVSKGSHSITLSNVVYIEQSDFKAVDEKKFFGLAPGKTVNLKYAHNITYASHETDAEGRVSVVYVTIDKLVKEKVKGNLHWVSGNVQTLEVRYYDYLFTTEFPGSVAAVTSPDAVEKPEDDDSPDWIAEINPKSELVYKGALADAGMVFEKQGKFQFERIGYFSVDDDSTPDAPVMNMTVLLKSSKSKKSLI